MDESGNSGEKSDPNQPIHLLGCMVVDASNVNEFESELDELARAYFPTTWKEVELRGHDIYSGKKQFKSLSVQSRIDLARDVLEKVNEYALGFGYTGIDKVKSYANDHPHRIAFGLMIEGLQPFCKQRDKLGLIIADEYNEISKTLLRDFSHMKRHGTFWGYRRIVASNIVDTIHFVNSADNRLIQACDLMTFFTLAHHRLTDDKWKKWIAMAEPRPKYQEWLEDGLSKADKATLELGRIASRVTRFRAKIFP